MEPTDDYREMWEAAEAEIDALRSKLAGTKDDLRGCLAYLDSLTPQPVTGPSGWRYLRHNAVTVRLYRGPSDTSFIECGPETASIPPCDRETVAALMERGK